MKIREISVRKAKRITTKAPDGSYEMNEIDIGLTVDGEKTKEQEVIDKVEKLVEENLYPKDPTKQWIDFHKKEANAQDNPESVKKKL